MDYESLKELNRVLKPGGRLIVTYLPNAASLEEWRLRRRGRNDFHRRLYSSAQLRALLTHCGFWPLLIAYQTQLDALPADHGVLRGLRPLARAAQLHRLTSCLCAVAEKATYF
jgi:SAM-dependent methyltransferase